MRIAVLSSAASIGGTELSSLRICNMLKNRGDDVVYIAPGNALKDEMRDIPFIQYSVSRRNPFSLVLAVKKLDTIFKKEQIDVVHCQDAASCVLCCYTRKYLKSSVRIIWHERGIHYKSYTTMSTKYSSYIDKIICNSYFERSLLTINHCPLEKMVVIYNCIEQQKPSKEKEQIRSEIGIKNTDFVLGGLGRVAWDKGFSNLIEAAAECKKDIPNLKVLIVGDGAEMDNCKRTAEKVGMADRVVFTGMRRDIADMLSAMDVFAIPSLWEAFGNTTVEAMLAKRPVLASRVGGIQEVVQDGINGFLLPAGEKKPWAEKIKYVHDHYGDLEPMVEQAYQDACERYNFDVYYEKIMDVYKGRT